MKKHFAITLGNATSRKNHTGAWRTERPEYVSLMPPCNAACPAGENIQAWLARAEEGDYRGAWESLVENNPLPAIMGRACYHSCEKSCLRRKLDEPVSVHLVERFLGDLAIREKWSFPGTKPSTGKRVLVVGSGPAGLSAAYHLARLGHSVTLREAAEKAGGMMRYGIPTYRLPRDVLDAELTRILDLGVTLELRRPVADVAKEMAEGGFDASFAALGAQLAERVDIPGIDASRLYDALAMLHDRESGVPVQLGRRVLVYGGGNTALDIARTAKRLGAEEACVVYRRTRAKMPARDFEVVEALEEGIQFRWLETLERAEGDRIIVERMELDEHGVPRGTGEHETLTADSVVLAIGQKVDATPLAGAAGVEIRKGLVGVDAHMKTGHAGVFAGGDMTPGDRAIAVAVGHGKHAARAIDDYVRGVPSKDETRGEVARFESLNTWYYDDASATVAPTLDAARRASTFGEVHGSLDEESALFEARRCMSCGNCFECDNCFGVCPDNAVIKLGPGKGYGIDLDFCKGCGLCASECPCGSIKMRPEDA